MFISQDQPVPQYAHIVLVERPIPGPAYRYLAMFAVRCRGQHVYGSVFTRGDKQSRAAAFFSVFNFVRLSPEYNLMPGQPTQIALCKGRNV